VLEFTSLFPESTPL